MTDVFEKSENESFLNFVLTLIHSKKFKTSIEQRK